MFRVVRIIIVVAALMSGCSKEYVYTAPQTEAGIACVTQCQERQTACREHVTSEAEASKQRCEEAATEEYVQCELQAEAEFSACQETAETEYYGCLKYAPNRKKCRQDACVKSDCYKRSCYRSVNHSFCDREFRGCFQQCGGRIEEL